jgi:hypothetical protein
MRGNIYMPCSRISGNQFLAMRGNPTGISRPAHRAQSSEIILSSNHQPCENCAGYCHGDQYAFGHIITVTQQNTQVSMQGELRYELASCAWNTRRPITVACAPHRSHGLLPKSPVSVRLLEYAHRSASHALHSPNSILQTQGTSKDHAAVPHDRISPESPCIQAFSRPGSRPKYYGKWSNAPFLPSTLIPVRHSCLRGSGFSCMVIFR